MTHSTQTTSAHPAQNYQPQSNGIVFIILLSLSLALAYAIQHGMIVEGFIYGLSYFFDNFHVTIKNSNLIADIALSIVILLAFYGLYCLIQSFLMLTVAVVILAVVAAIFFADTNTLKTTALQSNHAEKSWGVNHG